MYYVVFAASNISKSHFYKKHIVHFIVSNLIHVSLVSNYINMLKVEEENNCPCYIYMNPSNCIEKKRVEVFASIYLPFWGFGSPFRYLRTHPAPQFTTSFINSFLMNHMKNT